MTPAQRWAQEAVEAGLAVRSDARGLLHVVNRVDGMANCGWVDLPQEASAGERVCMDCRVLPAFERHYVAVTGGHS